MKKRFWPLVLTYVVSLLITIALLVIWVVYVVRSGTTIERLAERLSSAVQGISWGILTVGCVLAALLIVGLTYQLALALTARRYSSKQEEFISNITHEMKSPLAGIKLHAQTLEQPSLSPAQRERSLALILQEAERMGRLVDNVLESSRLLARKSRLALERVELAPFLGAYLEKAVPRLGAQGIRLRMIGRARETVLATEEGLERILTNLVDNAVRFSTRGGEVRLRVIEVPGQVSLAIEDDGLGIPTKELTKIFDRFYQIGKEISGRRRGTGLGLSIVSGLVREMRGSIRAYSQEGKPGTQFIVRLPTIDPLADTTAAKASGVPEPRRRKRDLAAVEPAGASAGRTEGLGS